MLVIPCYSISSNSVSLFSELYYDNGNSFRTGNSSINKVTKFNHNKLSYQSRKKLERNINNMLLLANEKKCYNERTKSQFKFKLNFITLTLSSEQIHTDQFIKKHLLHQFITELQQINPKVNYVWKAERQLNGNIHFHLVTDIYIHWNELRNKWNRIQEKYGYVSRYKESMKSFYKEGFKTNERYLKYSTISKQREYYEKGIKTDWNNPNSTDIHSTKKVKDIASYMCKYMLKDMFNNHIRTKVGLFRPIQSFKAKKREAMIERGLKAKVETVSQNALKYLGKLADNGRIWAASYVIGKIKSVTKVLNNDIVSILQNLAKLKVIRSYSNKYSTLYFFNPLTYLTNQLKIITDEFFEYINCQTGISLQLSLV